MVSWRNTSNCYKKPRWIVSCRTIDTTSFMVSKTISIKQNASSKFPFRSTCSTSFAFIIIFIVCICDFKPKNWRKKKQQITTLVCNLWWDQIHFHRNGHKNKCRILTMLFSASENVYAWRACGKKAWDLVGEMKLNVLEKCKYFSRHLFITDSEVKVWLWSS